MKRTVFFQSFLLALTLGLVLPVAAGAAESIGDLPDNKPVIDRSDDKTQREPRSAWDSDTRTMHQGGSYKRTSNTGNSFDRDARNNIDGGAESQDLGNLTNPGKQ